MADRKPGKERGVRIAECETGNGKEQMLIADWIRTECFRGHHSRRSEVKSLQKRRRHGGRPSEESSKAESIRPRMPSGLPQDDYALGNENT